MGLLSRARSIWQERSGVERESRRRGLLYRARLNRTESGCHAPVARELSPPSPERVASLPDDVFSRWIELVERESLKAQDLGHPLVVCEFFFAGLQLVEGANDLVKELGLVIRESLGSDSHLTRIAVDGYGLVLAGQDPKAQEDILDGLAKSILDRLAAQELDRQVRLERYQGRIPGDYPTTANWIYRDL